MIDIECGINVYDTCADDLAFYDSISFIKKPCSEYFTEMNLQYLPSLKVFTEGGTRKDLHQKVGSEETEQHVDQNMTKEPDTDSVSFSQEGKKGTVNIYIINNM